MSMEDMEEVYQRYEKAVSDQRELEGGIEEGAGERNRTGRPRVRVSPFVSPHPAAAMELSANKLDISNLRLQNLTAFQYKCRKGPAPTVLGTGMTIAGPCERAYNTSWTIEEKEQLAECGAFTNRSCGLPLNVEVRKVVHLLYAGADEGYFSWTIQACEDGSREGSEGILLHIERILSFSESVLLEASFYHVRAEDFTDALMHKVMPRLGGEVRRVLDRKSVV